MKITRKMIVIIAVNAVVAAGVLFFCWRYAYKADLRRLQQAEYDSAFFSMVPYRNIEEDAVGPVFFMDYLGINTAAADRPMRDEGMLTDYLETVLGSENEVSHIYLELVPFKLDSITCLNSLLETYPQTEFHILLAAPSMDYWTSQSERRTAAQMDAYTNLSTALLGYGNVELYFAGAQDWLIENPGNYTASMTLNGELLHHVALLTYCDGIYGLDFENYIDVFGELKNKVGLAKDAPAGADLSDWCLVFFGDSVIGNYTNSSSIPGAVASLSGCQAYNLGIGGTSAFWGQDSRFPFPEISEYFCQRDIAALNEGTFWRQEMEAYCEEKHDGKQICFVLNYGLNDYFCGCPIDDAQDPFNIGTYSGGLRSGIRKLLDAYPDAAIVLAAPTFTTIFSSGQDIMSPVGGYLTDYVEAAEGVAREMNVIFMNNYAELGVDASSADVYLEDGVHLGDSGRFLYAQALIRLIEAQCDEEGKWSAAR